MSFARMLSSLAAVTGLLLVPSLARAEFPTLERAIQMARERALVVSDAQSELGVAHAQMAGARVSSFGNPYTDVQVDRPFSKLPEDQREIQALTFTYLPIDFAGQRGKRIDEAERLIDWRKFGLVDARAIATGDVVASYGEMVLGAERVRVMKLGEQTAREESKYFQGRFDSKDTTLYEKSVADAEVARWVQSRAEASLRFSQTRARFEVLTGQAAVDAPPENADTLPPGLRGAWDEAQMTKVIEKSPLVQKVLAERHYWDASQERYERERIPPISLELLAGRGSSGELRLGGGAVVTFPITRRYQGEIARAAEGSAHANKRLGIYRTILTSRIKAARDAITGVKSAIEELDRTGIPALEAAVSASQEGFKAGKIDLTRTLLARRDLAIARGRRLDLLEAGWRAYADLVTLSGELP